MAVTLTFGDVAENHVGMQKHGEKASSGLSVETLERACGIFRERHPGIVCETFDLVALSGILHEHSLEPASIIVVRGGVNALLATVGGNANSLLSEQTPLETDKKAFMRGQVKNKLARHNLCFSDVGILPKYESGQGRVIAYSEVPQLDQIRRLLPDYFGRQAEKLQVEGNYYYDTSKCGIGFHGDSERRIVVAVRLGASIPLHYQWFYHSSPIGARIVIHPPLRHGDIYAMSDAAVGWRWRRSSIPTLRHAAGSPKFLEIKIRDEE